MGPDRYSQDRAKALSRQLSLTCGVSIDKYLNINKKLYTDGVHAIATAFHFFELDSIEKLPFNNPNVQGDWYTYLYRQMIQGLETPKELLRVNENKVSFITFNYDRSLEHFLFTALHGLLKNAEIPKEKLSDKLIKIPIVHVYGKIGYLPWEKHFTSSEDCVPYAADQIPPGNIAVKTHGHIKLIYDERKGSPELEKAKELISNADRIFFLGFGYDEMNISILDLPDLLRGKFVLGTALNSTEKERDQIETKLGFRDVDPQSKIIDCDCLKLLRDHLI